MTLLNVPRVTNSIVVLHYDFKMGKFGIIIYVVLTQQTVPASLCFYISLNIIKYNVCSEGRVIFRLLGMTILMNIT